MGLCRNLTILICHIQQLTFGWGWDFKVKKGGMGGLAEKKYFRNTFDRMHDYWAYHNLVCPSCSKSG